MRLVICLSAPCLATILLSPSFLRAGETSPAKSLFAKDNLVAWCVVPFDAKKRGPKERAEMLQRLGFKKLAYDWRSQHVPTFEEEILQMKKHGIEFYAFWGLHPSIAPLINKHQIVPEIWQTLRGSKKGTQQEKIEAAAKGMLPLVKQTKELGCRLGLYNHGGWGGEPENLVAVTKWLRENADADHVGIIYNFHHGHGHLDRFPKAFNDMVPYLFCVNLNGMTQGGAKILPVGQGSEDLKLLKMIRDSGYRGPIGILDHVSSEDSEVVLRRNLDGLKKLLEQLGDTKALKTYE